jgi:hypothetical protein
MRDEAVREKDEEKRNENGNHVNKRSKRDESSVTSGKENQVPVGDGFVK